MAQPTIVAEPQAMAPHILAQDLPIIGMFHALELADKQKAAQVKERERAMLLLMQKLEDRIELLTKENAALRVRLETAESLQRETDILHKGEVEALNNLVEAAKGETAHFNHLHKQETESLKSHIQFLVQTAHSSAQSIAAKSQAVLKKNRAEITKISAIQIKRMDFRDAQRIRQELTARTQFHQSMVDEASSIASQAIVLSKFEEKK